jgi:hypothetical protein
MKTLKRGIHIFAIFMCLLIIVPGVMFAQDVIAYVGELGGSVTIIKNNPGEEEVEATLGMLLVGGDTVKTGEASYSAVIFQDDGSRVKLGENSQLTLNAERDRKKLKKRLFLGSGGKIWAKITKKRGTDFQVKTPTSVASVKGTTFSMEEASDGTYVWVYADSVFLRNGDMEKEVQTGEYGFASEGDVETGPISENPGPVEPGPHEMIIYFVDQTTGRQKELRIEYTKPD